MAVEQPPEASPPENRAREMERALLGLAVQLQRIRLLVILGGAILLILILGAVALFIIVFQANP